MSRGLLGWRTPSGARDTHRLWDENQRRWADKRMFRLASRNRASAERRLKHERFDSLESCEGIDQLGSIP